MAHNKGVQGCKWYHGAINRMVAEALLIEDSRDGSFLVRDSENIKGAFALSVLHDHRISQYRIIPAPEGPGFLMKSSEGIKQHRFSNLVELINSYKIATNGLVCTLKHPVEAKKQIEEDAETDDDDDDEHLDHVSQFLESQIENMNQVGLERDFLEALRNYAVKGSVQDAEAVKSGSSSLPQLTQLLHATSKDFVKQLDIFLFKIELIKKIFNRHKVLDRHFGIHSCKKTGDSVEHLLSRIEMCPKAFHDMETKAHKTFQSLVKNHETGNTSEVGHLYMPSPDDAGHGTSHQDITNLSDRSTLPEIKPSLPPLRMPNAEFEVKAEGLKMEALMNPRVKLTIDVQQGVFIVTRLKEPKESTSYQQNKIVQLIKSRENPTRLAMRFNNNKKREYSFETAKEREKFCLLIQTMKNMHSHSEEVDQISLFIGTYNMGDAVPTAKLDTWLTSQGIGKTRPVEMSMMPHDLYVIGTQESTLSEKDWVKRLKATISRNTSMKDEYIVLTLISLWGIRMAVLVKPEHANCITHVRESSVKTGIANTLGNKGAVGVSFYFNGTSFCFINCHLTSGTEKCLRRNHNYHDILRGLAVGDKGLSMFDLNTRFHHVFWFGDLNYRLDRDVQEILVQIKSKNYQTLLSYDQLKEEREKLNVFIDFEEEEITFPPTYRYEIGNRKTYAYKKIKKTGVRINQPSWCDRVLWKSYPDTHINNTSYGCTTDIVSSDHSPVFASFSVGIESMTIPSKDHGNDEEVVQIIFTQMDADIQTSSNGKFYVEIFSSCLAERSVKGRKSDICYNKNFNLVSTAWSADDFPKLKPIVSNFHYLEEQHMLITIKNSDSDESYGEFVVALKNKLSTEPVGFKANLTHNGLRTGSVSGKMHVKARDESAYGACVKPRTYDLVKFDDRSDTTSSVDSHDILSDNNPFTSNKNKRPGLVRIIDWNNRPQLPEPTSETPTLQLPHRRIDLSHQLSNSSTATTPDSDSSLFPLHRCGHYPPVHQNETLMQEKLAGSDGTGEDNLAFDSGNLEEDLLNPPILPPRNNFGQVDNLTFLNGSLSSNCSTRSEIKPPVNNPPALPPRPSTLDKSEKFNQKPRNPVGKSKSDVSSEAPPVPARRKQQETGNEDESAPRPNQRIQRESKVRQIREFYESNKLKRYQSVSSSSALVPPTSISLQYNWKDPRYKPKSKNSKLPICEDQPPPLPLKGMTHLTDDLEFVVAEHRHTHAFTSLELVTKNSLMYQRYRGDIQYLNVCIIKS
ncbi:phosphatidylinositol 3,4,5-trisphosphate 5-phosphatase 1-like isoform X2 [Anneissia japonica]|uniref:phosphatidylinositol 3,4,5-trisphosphate 5-phosphatase 1-like isoform X2 n=1 Tax=Anneissia japonica TaxID=1529436 RepID=UPI001425A5ED|nr:phosphatidylinositol 3,4,5-trisphosphate 5-phosphatase 1-like isoform X2 [Anneissia japonica]